MSDFQLHEPDAETITRLRGGDVAALSTVFRLCGARIYRLCRRMLGNDHDAEDALQDIFLRAYERASRFDGRARFSTWLYRLALHHCLNVLEKRQRRLSREVPAGQAESRGRAPTGDLDTRLEREESAGQLDAWLEALPPHYRACLVLREVEGRSYAEIADLLGIPVGTVMSRLARAREQLRRVARRGPDFPEGLE